MANPQTYLRPTTLDEARQHAARPASIAFAGGALLLAGFDLPYETVIDLQAIPELNRIDVSDSAVTLGGAVRLQQIIDETPLPPVFKRSLTRYLPLNQRNGTSIAESLIVPRPPTEWLAALTAHDVGVEVLDRDGQRTVYQLGERVETGAESTLHSGIITTITIPLLTDREAIGTAFVARTPADDPIVNVAAFVRLDDDSTIATALLAICGASNKPVRLIDLSEALEGDPLDDEPIAAAANLVTAAVEPVADWRGSADYRRAMAGVLTRRALVDAQEHLSHD